MPPRVCCMLSHCTVGGKGGAVGHLPGARARVYVRLFSRPYPACPPAAPLHPPTPRRPSLLLHRLRTQPRPLLLLWRVMTRAEVCWCRSGGGLCTDHFLPGFLPLCRPPLFCTLTRAGVWHGCLYADHLFVPSSRTIPHNDPTLLFTNAGMNQVRSLFRARALSLPLPFSLCSLCVHQRWHEPGEWRCSRVWTWQHHSNTIATPWHHGTSTCQRVPARVGTVF